MKKNLTKVLCSMLAMAFLFGFVALPGMVRVSAANEFPSVVSEITLADSDTTTANTLGKYDLLQDPTEGFTLEEGDVYVFDMDIYTGSYNSGGKAWAFGFDLLGNPTVFENRELRVSGIEFNNDQVLYWPEAWSQGTATSTVSPKGDGKLFVWGTGDYHYRFTVRAYESIQLEWWGKNTAGGYSNSDPEYVGTVAWSNIYGLKALKSGDGTEFKPAMAFFDQNGKITNIAVRYTGTNGGAIKTADEIKLEDSDTTSTFTMAKYDLLKSTEGITLEEGGTYVFDMDIWRDTTASGAVRRDIFFDLLGNVQLKSDNKSLMVGSGVYYGQGTFMYWKTAWENAFVTTSTAFDIWTGSESAATYHYRFTVKAYESIRVEFWFKSTAQGYSDFEAKYDGTVAWNNIYGLKDLKPGDGTKFKPAMAFFDQNGKISNIHAVYIPAPEPVFTEAVADISAYRTEGAYTAPEKDGYVFAGWFRDEDCTSPVAVDTVSGSAYAKWVTEDVLSVKAQVLADTTAASESTDLRFLTTVDSLDYQNIGFSITINTKTNTPASTSVYKTITARSDGAVVAKDPTVFSEVSEYFHTYTITKIPSSAFGTEITVTPYWTTLDGTVANGVARTLTVNEIISTIANA